MKHRASIALQVDSKHFMQMSSGNGGGRQEKDGRQGGGGREGGGLQEKKA